jgi:hypothetical protein
MFLSKKNPTYFNKLKNIEAKPKRILGGMIILIKDGEMNNNRENKHLIMHKR